MAVNLDPQQVNRRLNDHDDAIDDLGINLLELSRRVNVLTQQQVPGVGALVSNNGAASSAPPNDVPNGQVVNHNGAQPNIGPKRAVGLASICFTTMSIGVSVFGAPVFVAAGCATLVARWWDKRPESPLMH